MNEVITTAIDLKDTFEELSLKSDAVKSGYAQNNDVICKALAGEKISYHLSTVNLGCIRVLQDSWDLSETELKRLISAISNFDEALNKKYG